jgi:hypothetical protein
MISELMRRLGERASCGSSRRQGEDQESVALSMDKGWKGWEVRSACVSRPPTSGDDVHE